MRGFQRYVLAGLVTIIPLFVTWVIIDFVLGILARIGGPLARWLAGVFDAREGVLSAWLAQGWLQWLLAIAITIVALYLLGLAASRVVGRRLIKVAERVLGRLPFVQNIYGATKKLVDVLRTKQDERPVVLIDFPHDKMKTLGLVTRIISDEATGAKLAVVYVPTTPNPTSGYLEIVPLEYVVYTDMSFEEGMSFVVTGGAIGRDTIPFSRTDRKHHPDRTDLINTSEP
ncbi:MAG: DUF502 domain-containing protein [Bauldia sp.]|nr:DUF502 domain-containing protein [Bauldia sp.]